MDTLTIKIRGDLRRYRQQILNQHKDRWRMMQIVVLASSLIVLGLAFIEKPHPIQHFVPLLLFSPIFYLLATRRLWSNFPRGKLLNRAFAALLIVLSFTAGFLYPDQDGAQNTIAPWLTLTFPFITWPILVRLFMAQPQAARRYGMQLYQPFLNIGTGIFIGAALAFHQFLVSRILPGVPYPLPILQPEATAWLVGVLTGLVIPAEELLFRGEAFSLHFDHLGNSLRSSIIRITVLNSAVYLVLMLYSMTNFALLTAGILGIVYKAILSAACLFYMFRRRNLMTCYTANLTYMLLAGQVFFL